MGKRRYGGGYNGGTVPGTTEVRSHQAQFHRLCIKGWWGRGTTEVRSDPLLPPETLAVWEQLHVARGWCYPEARGAGFHSKLGPEHTKGG